MAARKKKTTKKTSSKTGIELRFIFNRSTKNTHRFHECNGSGEELTREDEPKVGTIYVQKSAFDGDTPPERLLVTIEPVVS